MMRRLMFWIIAVLLTFFHASIVLGYDDKITHPEITGMAVKNANLDKYLKNNLGLGDGIQTKIPLNSNNDVLLLLRKGSELEDDHPCRAANHFHNPLLPWNASQMADDSTPLAYLIREYCNTVGWPYIYRKSNVTWATGYLSSSPDGNKYMFLSSEPLPINWDTARASYYSALTERDAATRDTDFATTFSALGHVLHLIQDMAVPAHVRNDFQSHLISASILPWDILSVSNYYNRFEHYVANNNNLIQESRPPQFSGNVRLTDFWDTDKYTGTNPSKGDDQGLAEFTNANYFSEFTIPFNQPFIPLAPEHTFPNPGQYYYGNAYKLCKDVNEKGQIVTYLSRQACPSSGGQVDHFLTVSLINPPLQEAIFFWTDDNVHNTYAKELLPRAVGYSAGLLNYFFRGTIEISLPDEGIYSITGPGGTFNKIKLKARNTTASGEEMTNGMIQLVVKYKIAQTDPFHNYTDCVETTADFSYIVASEANGITSLSTGTTTLTFNLNPGIPLEATDVYLQVVYRGQLGNEADAVAVGFKDISEPSPIDLINSMDYVCKNGVNVPWPVLEPIIYVYNLYLAFTPTAYASFTNYSVKIPSIPPGYYGRVYVLAEDVISGSYTRDGWLHSGISSDWSVKIQTDFIDGQARCSAPDDYFPVRGLGVRFYGYFTNTTSSVCLPIDAPLSGPVAVEIP